MSNSQTNPRPADITDEKAIFIRSKVKEVCKSLTVLTSFVDIEDEQTDTVLCHHTLAIIDAYLYLNAVLKYIYIIDKWFSIVLMTILTVG